MNSYATHAYKAVSVNTTVDGATPHKLILMLYDGLLRHLQQRPRLQGVVKRLVHRQHDLRRGRGGIFFFGFRGRFRAGHQVGGASKVADQLADRCARGRALKNDRIVQSAGRDARSVAGGNAG